MFRFNKPIIKDPMVCASLKLLYGHQLKYFVIELFGRVAAYYVAGRGRAGWARPRTIAVLPPRSNGKTRGC
jgi:hypothetical protein